jgi:hypothetical protein
MNIKELAQGYFQMSEDEKREVIYLATKYYIEDMVISKGNLPQLRVHLILLQGQSALNEDYEVTEVLGEIIGGLNEILEDIKKEEE